MRLHQLRQKLKLPCMRMVPMVVVINNWNPGMQGWDPGLPGHRASTLFLYNRRNLNCLIQSPFLNLCVKFGHYFNFMFYFQIVNLNIDCHCHLSSIFTLFTCFVIQLFCHIFSSWDNVLFILFILSFSLFYPLVYVNPYFL